MPGGSGLGERFRRDVRQGQRKRQRSVQGAAEPGEDQIRPGTVAAAKLGAKTVPAVGWRRGTGIVDGAHAGTASASAEEGQR